MTPSQIRREIAASVDAEILRQGVQGAAWLDQEKWHKSTCGLVNPLCPDDLCILPPGHVGTAEGYHVTGTTPYTHAIEFPLEFMTTRRNRAWLIQEGCRRAQVMYPA